MILTVVADEVREMAGCVQLCAGQEAGGEAGVRAMAKSFEDDNTEAVKVAALAHVSKSNPYNFWRRGRVMDLNYVSEVLCRSLLACASYGRKEKVKITTNSKCYLIN